MVAMCLASREPGPSDKAFLRRHTIVTRPPATFQRASKTRRRIAAALH
jgi:hypothetical protein